MLIAQNKSFQINILFHHQNSFLTVYEVEVKEKFDKEKRRFEAGTCYSHVFDPSEDLTLRLEFYIGAASSSNRCKLMVRSFIASGKSDYMHELELDEIQLILVSSN